VLGPRIARRWWARLNAPLLASGLATLLCAALFASHLAHCASLPGLEAWEASTEDARVRLAGARSPADDRIVIVALDDRTHAQAPELFQTRRGLARLIDAVAAGRPRVMGLDLFFASPEIRLDSRVVAQVEDALARLSAETAPSPAALSARTALSSVLEELRGDDVLAAAVRKARLVLAFLLHLDEAGARRAAPPGLSLARLSEAVVTDQPPGRRPARAADVTISMPSIATAAGGAGFVNIAPDDDGALRRMPLVLEYGGEYFAAFGLSLALASLGSGAELSYVTGDEFVELDGRRVAVDRRGLAALSYLGPGGTFPHLSAVDVVRGAVPPGSLAGKIVLVGYTDVARDVIIQPFDGVCPGVEAHATLVHNLLHDELLRRVEPRTALLLVIGLGAVITLLQIRRLRQRGSWVVGTGALAATAAYFAVSQYVYAAHGTFVPVVAPVLAAALVTAAALSTGLATEGREKARLRSAFSRYVPPGVVERILADPSRIRLGGERRELTVLFSDIRGFSRSAENLEPEVLSEYLNEFLTPMTHLVLDQGGMLDKYIGDALMAVYGAPLEVPDHPARACRTALSMLGALAPLNAEFARRGLPAVQVGIGINSGPMSVGNMGSQARFDYTVLGDAVNLGARLEALTRDYRVDVLVGEKTAALAAGEFVFRELDTVRVKGRAGVGSIHELCGPRGAARFSDGDLAAFAAALADYRAARWGEAEERLARFLERHPDDGPARVMIERLAALRARPPEGAWDGVFDQLVK
jgi:adenylate cyclase